MLLNIRQLMDDAKCYEVVRELRWPDGVKCPACDSGQINKRGFHDHQAHRQRYSCQECGRQFADVVKINKKEGDHRVALFFIPQPWNSWAHHCPGSQGYEHF